MSYQKEALIKRSSILPIHKELNFIKGSLSVCKITFMDGLDMIFGTGFFIKFKRDKTDNKYQYFLMTCEHVIKKEIIDLNNVDLNIFYHYESIHKIIKLNKYERFIKEYKTNYNIDITIIQIMQEDNISWVYFLEPDYNIRNGFEQYKNKEIIIHQFPLGNELCFSRGRIDKINEKDKIMHYKSSTEKGSSGSPIIIVDSKLVIGIHFRGNYEHEYYGDSNYGNFIIDVLDDAQRINSVEYLEEENYNYDNLTDRQLLAKKTYNERIYNIDKFRIRLFYDENRHLLEFTIENIKNKEKYICLENYKGDMFYNFIHFDDFFNDANIKEINNELILENNNIILIIKKIKNDNSNNMAFRPFYKIDFNENYYNCELMMNGRKIKISEFINDSNKIPSQININNINNINDINDINFNNQSEINDLDYHLGNIEIENIFKKKENYNNNISHKKHPKYYKIHNIDNNSYKLPSLTKSYTYQESKIIPEIKKKDNYIAKDYIRFDGVKKSLRPKTKNIGQEQNEQFRPTISYININNNYDLNIPKRTNKKHIKVWTNLKKEEDERNLKNDDKKESNINNSNNNNEGKGSNSDNCYVF